MTIRKLLGLGAYVAGVAVFFEAAARFAFWAQPLPALRRLGNDDASWRLRWLRRRAEGTAFTYTFDVHHPVRGWALASSLRDLPVFNGKVLNSNAGGLRGRREHAYSRPPGRGRVLVFGDSFTFGEGVSDEDAYPAQLEQLLPGTDVLNFGVHGYGHDQMLLYLREQGLRYEADVVVLGFLDIDVERCLLSFRDYAKPRFVLLAGRLVLRGTPVPPPEDVLAREPWRSRLLDLLTITREGWMWSSGANPRTARAVTAAILDEFRSAAQAARLRLLVAYLPAFRELEPGGPSEGERFAEAACRERGIAFANLRTYFLARRAAGGHTKMTGHWNRALHRVAAEALVPWLLPLLPATPGRGARAAQVPPAPAASPTGRLRPSAPGSRAPTPPSR